MIARALHCGPGLPKPAVPRLFIDAGGVRDDVNRYRFEGRRGDPDMAVSLYSVELAAAVAAEGWPEVVPGALGENISTRGVPVDALAAGQRWRVGEALIEISRRMQPCRTLTALVGPARLLALQKCLRDRRGWYARVIEPGVVDEGAAIAQVG